MTATTAPSPRTRSGKRRPPGFAKGAVLGVLVMIPLISLGIWLANRLGIGEVRPTLIGVLRLVVVFAGVPAVVTAGGVGRLAAQASVDGGRTRAMWMAGSALAFGGIGAIVIGAIPNEVIPASGLGWGALAAVGALAGTLAGVAIGLVCSGEMPTLAELGMWPPEGTMGRAMDLMVRRAVRRRRRPAADRPDRP